MKHQDQKYMKALDFQVSERSQEHQDQNVEIQSYRAPQMFLVGKAKHLMANQSGGNSSEGGMYYYAY